MKEKSKKERGQSVLLMNPSELRKELRSARRVVKGIALENIELYNSMSVLKAEASNWITKYNEFAKKKSTEIARLNMQNSQLRIENEDLKNGRVSRFATWFKQLFSGLE